MGNMRIGLLTGGGDCPGLNAAIRAVVRAADPEGDTIVGFHHGWRGVVDDDAQVLHVADTRGILQSGGTVLRTARFHPDEHPGGIDAVHRTLERHGLDALIVVGGDGTLEAARRIAATGVHVVGIPKTIDNDVPGTTRCIGFETAVATAADAIDRVHTTAESHDRLMVVEVMGRSTGWLALCSGLAAGAEALCLPERPTDIAQLAATLSERHDAGASSSVVVVAEGARFVGAAVPPFSGPGAHVAASLAGATGFDTRLTVLGHVQRGGTPVPADRLLATRMGIVAFDAARHGATAAMIAAVGDGLEEVPLSAVSGPRRALPDDLLDMARRLAIC
jgi:ATP-dependent phosphofructokinase / diphosphate-dependent phosphofructokinase